MPKKKRAEWNGKDGFLHVYKDSNHCTLGFQKNCVYFSLNDYAIEKDKNEVVHK